MADWFSGTPADLVAGGILAISGLAIGLVMWWLYDSTKGRRGYICRQCGKMKNKNRKREE